MRPETKPAVATGGGPYRVMVVDDSAVIRGLLTKTLESDAEIKAWLTARYSDFVLYDPPLHGATLLLWFGPALVLLAGGAAVVFAVRRRARVTTAPAAPQAAIDTEDDW